MSFDKQQQLIFEEERLLTLLRVVLPQAEVPLHHFGILKRFNMDASSHKFCCSLTGFAVSETDSNECISLDNEKSPQ